MELSIRKPKILLTGAAGSIAGKLKPTLSRRYNLISIDIIKKKARNWHQFDLVNDDRESYAHLFENLHAVIHCACVEWPPWPHRASEKEAFDLVGEAEMDNIRMAYNIYKTSAEHKVRRVIMLSSNHATGFDNPTYCQKKSISISPDMDPRPHHMYGWAKVSIEKLGFTFAAGWSKRFNHLENIQIRLGDGEQGWKAENISQMRRNIGSYISKRDMQQLIIKSIETKDIRNKDGVPFQIFYGISDNTFGFWDISNAREVIGYEPKDDGMDFYRDRFARMIKKKKVSRSRKGS